mgnify:CR=1 FL=1
MRMDTGGMNGLSRDYWVRRQEGGQFTLELLGLNPNPTICLIIYGGARVNSRPNPH